MQTFRIFNIVLLSFIAFSFTACDRANSVGYYKKHPQEAKNKIGECVIKAIPVAFSGEKDVYKAMSNAYGGTFAKECKNAKIALEELERDYYIQKTKKESKAKANSQSTTKKQTQTLKMQENKPNPQPNVKSVEYYKNNSYEAREKLQECEDLEFTSEWQAKQFAQSDEGKIWYKECENVAKALSY